MSHDGGVRMGAVDGEVGGERAQDAGVGGCGRQEKSEGGSAQCGAACGVRRG